MKLAMTGGAMLALCFLAAYRAFGYWQVYQIAYGAIVLMAAMIAATFLWLWSKRATPLALGMVFSWTGGAGAMGWWWIYNLVDRPPWMADSPVFFVVLSIYMTGAAMHFTTIGASLGWPRYGWAIPVATAAGLSIALAAL